MAIIAAVVAGLKVYYPDIPEDAVKYVLYACLGYVATEGMVDAVSQLGRWLTEREVMRNGSTR